MSLVSRFRGALSALCPDALDGPGFDPEFEVVGAVVGDVLVAGTTVSGRLLFAFRRDVGFCLLVSWVARSRAFAFSLLISIRFTCSGVSGMDVLEDDTAGGGV